MRMSISKIHHPLTFLLILTCDASYISNTDCDMSLEAVWQDRWGGSTRPDRDWEMTSRCSDGLKQ